MRPKTDTSYLGKASKHSHAHATCENTRWLIKTSPSL